MGLIRAAIGAAKGNLGDQWKEYFYCESLPADILAVRGRKRTDGKANTRASDNVISNGSVIAIADGQCMMVVDQGKVMEVSAEPGEFVYDSSSEPSIFSGELGDGFGEMLANMMERFEFGGQAGKDQRVYFFNMKEIIGNKYGTASPVPFRVVDNNIGLDMDISVKCFGEYSYKIVNPILFYTNVCGNIAEDYRRTELDNQLKSELLTALQPAFARVSALGIRYSALPGHTMEMADALNEILSKKWRDTRGIEIVAFGMNSIKADEDDERMLKELQKNSVYRNPNMAAAQLVGAQAQAMQDAAKNTNAGPAMAFMGMNMAQQAGGASAQQLFQMGQQAGALGQGEKQAMQPGGQTPVQKAPPLKAPVQPAGGEAGPDGWVCSSCATLNKGKFCTECGSKKPAGLPKYRCDKCGWEPADVTKPPKFCPECGDPFDEADVVE